MPNDLSDHAEGTADFVLAGDLPDEDGFELTSLAVYDADNVPGEYPQYGSFIETTQNGNTVWVECPTGLARELVDAAAEPGDWFRVENAVKNDAGRWTFVISVDA